MQDARCRQGRTAATPRPTSTRQPLPIADNPAPETTSRPLLIRKKTPKTSVPRSSRTSRSRTPKRTSPTRRTPKKDSPTLKNILVYGPELPHREHPDLEHLGTSGIQTPYTSNVQISYTSGIQISYTSGNSSSIGILIQGTASTEDQKGLVHSKDAVQDLLLQKPPVLRRGLGILRSRCLSHSRQHEALRRSLMLIGQVSNFWRILLEHDTAWDRGTELSLH